MNLVQLTEKARSAAASGDYGTAEELLERGRNLLADEPSAEVLADYASTCGDWGSEELQARALRRAIGRRTQASFVVDLLGVLQHHLNSLNGEHRDSVAEECLRLGALALDLVPTSDEGLRADLTYNRGLRHLDLARSGKGGLLDQAEKDIRLYQDWVASSDTVPQHLRRGNVLALAGVELGEILLLGGQRRRAADLLEEAIAALEAGGVAAWMTKRAYALLERAWA